VRAVLDPNVLISVLLSRDGAPARVVRAWLDGRFELVVSEALLAELERALGSPKLRMRIPGEDGRAFAALLRDAAVLAPDPPERPPRSSDPGDDYLLALAASTGAYLVSGDAHLLALADRLPVRTPAAFLEALPE
jgi:putative PIN family toxin of toxin-antitoxin system